MFNENKTFHECNIINKNLNLIMHKCPIHYKCALCSTQPASVVASCGCTFCSSCYHEIKSYMSIDTVRCIICEEHIDFTKSLDINSPSIVNQLNITNEQKKKVLEFLKMSNEQKSNKKNKENNINIQSSAVDSNTNCMVNTSVKRTRKRNYTKMLQQLNEVSIYNNNMSDYKMTKKFKYC